MLRVFIVVALTVLTGCGFLRSDGEAYLDNDCCGGCYFVSYEGTCSDTGDSTFTFEGTIEGETVRYAGNRLYDIFTIPQGESIDCSIGFEMYGECVACRYGIGHCGDEAWAGYRCIVDGICE